MNIVKIIDGAYKGKYGEIVNVFLNISLVSVHIDDNIVSIPIKYVRKVCV